jgi:thiaminase/transcriptional activator TenA
MSVQLTSELRQSADHIWRKIFVHPFVVELYKGALPIEKFKFYMIQDFNFLVAMSKCFSLLASRADFKYSRELANLAYLEAVTEMKSYEELLNKLGLSLEEVTRQEPSPTNVAYTNFLLAVCALEEVLSGLVAILPCFWSYLEIAQVHRDLLQENRNELYKGWAQTYLSEDYAKLVDKLIRMVNELGEQAPIKHDKLRRIFLLASKYEYLFWDMAYNREKWAI